MLKEPRAGRVKTRLGRDIGMAQAAWWFRHQSRRLIRRMAADRRWRLVLAISPDRAAREGRIWPDAIARLPQGSGDLGTRMLSVFRRAGPGPVVIIGADIPAIRPRHVAAAFRALGSADSVFGPAVDGGFWLVGLKHAERPPIDMFRDVRWSSADTLANTLAGLDGRRIELLETLCDVDTGADLARSGA